MLSEKGQSILANQADIPSIRNDIEGKNDIDGMTKMLGNALKPIPVDETLILVPIFVSPMVLGFGYVVAAGPVGFFSLWAQSILGFVPWNIYDMSSIVVIAGLTHVPHAYLYISSALRSVGSDVEEAARKPVPRRYR